MSLDSHGEHPLSNGHPLGAILSGDEADTDGEHDRNSLRARPPTVNFRDFENEKGVANLNSGGAKPTKRSTKKQRKAGAHREKQSLAHEQLSNPVNLEGDPSSAKVDTPCVGPGEDAQMGTDSPVKRTQFSLRGLSGARPPLLPTMPRMLSTTVFSAANETGPTYIGPQGTGVTPRPLHRSNSLPSRLNHSQMAPTANAAPAVSATACGPSPGLAGSDKPKKYMSRTAAIVMLLISTALVAVCAEFLVSSIDYLVAHTSVSEAFIGLIVLPIVGNAAEHVTAVTVASKNKMDLAIGVAVGSSIQIALFVTPVIVLLGWILRKDMSLYFSLFETVSLFVTVFVVNFLVLDGRSNYLEGALLIAVYVIIAVAAFFYPDSDQQSQVGGAEDTMKMFRLL